MSSQVQLPWRSISMFQSKRQLSLPSQAWECTSAEYRERTKRCNQNQRRSRSASPHHLSYCNRPPWPTYDLLLGIVQAHVLPGSSDMAHTNHSHSLYSGKLCHCNHKGCNDLTSFSQVASHVPDDKWSQEALLGCCARVCAVAEFHPPPDQLHHPWRPPECSALLRHRCHPTPVAPACSFGQGDNITSHKLQSQPCCSLGKTGKNWISNIWSILMAFNDFPPTISSGSSRGSLWPSTSAPKPSMPLTDVRDTVQLLSWLRRSQPEPPASKLAGLRNALNFSWGIFHCVWRHQRDPEGTKSIQKLYNFGGAEITSDPCWNDESYISVILARILSLPLPPQNHPCPNLSKCLVAFPHFPRFATLIQWRLELAHAKPRIAGVFQLTIELMTVSPQGKHRDCCKIYF